MSYKAILYAFIIVLGLLSSRVGAIAHEQQP
jgi:hypothetical protein